METWLIVLPILLFSVVVHEVSHGLAAERCGDSTARMMGRITLNPLPHIDPVGSILVPALLILSNSSFFFAWAKPVPVNPYNFNRPGRDDILVSVAGPVSDFLLALGFSVLLVVFLWTMPSHGGITGWQQNMIGLFRYGIWINLILACFNLIPIPPLDGSHILSNVLPRQAAMKYELIRPYGFILLLVLIYFNLLNFFFIPARWLMSVLLKAVLALGSIAF